MYTTKEARAINDAWQQLMAFAECHRMGTVHEIGAFLRMEKAAFANSGRANHTTECRFYIMRAIVDGYDTPDKPWRDLAGIRHAIVLARVFGAGLAVKPDIHATHTFERLQSFRRAFWGDCIKAHDDAYRRTLAANKAEVQEAFAALGT